MQTKKIYTGIISRDRLGNLALKCSDLNADFGQEMALLEPYHFFEVFYAKNIEPEIGDTLQFTVTIRKKFIYVDKIMTINDTLLQDLTTAATSANPISAVPKLILP